jgi:hypothetical protein
MAFKFGNVGIMVSEANGSLLFSVGEVISDKQMRVTHRFNNIYEAWKIVMERVGFNTVLPKKLEQYL